MQLGALQEFYSSPALCTCASKSTAALAHLAHFVPDGTRNRNKNTLSDALAAFHCDRLFAEIEDLRLQLVSLTAVILVDDAHTVRDEQSLATWGAASKGKQQHITLWNAHDHIARNQFYRARLNLRIFATEQVKADRSCRGIRWQGQTGIYSFDIYQQMLRGCFHICYSKVELGCRQVKTLKAPNRIYWWNHF